MRVGYAVVLAFVLSLSLAPSLTFAKGDGGGDGGGEAPDDGTPPPPTETTTKCGDGKIWDDEAGACESAEAPSFDDNTRFTAVVELAYAGRYDEAYAILHTMTEGETARVMTYEGFLLRKTGQIEEGIAAYERAIALDAGNILARSYYGQLLVEMNELALAEAQLAAIISHGGKGTWSEQSLASAIETGTTYNY